MTTITLLEDELVNKIQGLAADIDAIQQPRSDFALEHFVVGQHDTPGRQRMQAVLELQIKMFNIRRVQIEEKKLMIEKRRQEKIQTSNGDDLDREMAAAEIERIEVDLAEMNLARMGAVREASALLNILDKLPKYTYEELQAEEEEAWRKRMSRQAMQDMRSIGTISAGNLDAINQMLKRFTAHGLTLPVDGTLSIAQLADIATLPTIPNLDNQNPLP